MLKDDISSYPIYLIPYKLQFFADEGGDKSEDATTKKLGDARNEGQVAKSTELITASSLATLFIILKLFSGFIGTRFIDTYYGAFNNIDKLSREDFNSVVASNIMTNQIINILITCLPVFVTVVTVSFLVVLIQVKWKISTKAMKPKFSKINPISGFKKIFSKDKLFELVIEVIKIIVICYVAYDTLSDDWKTLLVLYDMKLEQAIILIGNMVIDLGIQISMIFIVIGFADFIYQKLKFKKDMKMTKQEVKDEYKNSEGDPQVKGRIKQKMREVSQRRMMQALPKADVVITNPTHLAAAIKYDKSKSEAPILIAKGADYIALKIKEIAKENNIVIVENKPLARMLYYNVDLDQEIPPELYQMTAEVLAYVYGLKNK
ncbi:MAG: flagellar biosynthesis protein FlhB [Mobilitalea sp.]